MQKIKLGIVGFGFMGHCDADMMKTFQNIDLVAVADTNPQQLEDAPEGVETYADIDEMLEHADINTVMVSTPNPSHPEMVKKAANKKKHVICEKPFTLHLEEFEELGYEILPNKYFYKYQEPENSDALIEQFWQLEEEATQLLAEIKALEGE